MLLPKEKLIEKLEKEFIKNAFENKNDIYNNLLNKYNIEFGISSDIFTQRRYLGEFSDFVLFAVLSEISPKSIEEYFTNAEIEIYSTSKYEKENIIFPLKFDAIEVRDDQWITKTTVKTLMSLRDAGLINYNPNTQRTMQKIERGGKTVGYKVEINLNQVKEISKSMLDGTYIPDIITINIPAESDALFSFNKGKLIIDSIDHFDIADGYHRLTAMGRACNMKEGFDYPMELRIVNFSESKAQQFIFQADQKTKMKRINSDSYNQSSVENIIAKKINEDPGFDLNGKISDNGGLIELSYFAKLIAHFYAGKSVENIRQYSTLSAKLIVSQMNHLLSEIPELYTREWDRRELIAAMFAFDICGNNFVDIVNEFKLALENIKEIEKEKSISSYVIFIRKRPFNMIVNKLKEMRGV